MPAYSVSNATWETSAVQVLERHRGERVGCSRPRRDPLDWEEQRGCGDRDREDGGEGLRPRHAAGEPHDEGHEHRRYDREQLSLRDVLDEPRCEEPDLDDRDREIGERCRDEHSHSFVVFPAPERLPRESAERHEAHTDGEQHHRTRLPRDRRGEIRDRVLLRLGQRPVGAERVSLSGREARREPMAPARPSARPGILMSAVGVGGLLGAAATVVLIGRRKLSPAIGGGILLTGLALVAVAFSLIPLVACVLLAVAGFGKAFVDVAGRTLLHRAVRPEVMSRVFGVQESMIMGGVAVGAVMTPFMINNLGARESFVVTGVFLPVVGLLALIQIRKLDDEALLPGPGFAAARSHPDVCRAAPRNPGATVARAYVGHEFPQEPTFSSKGMPVTCSTSSTKATSASFAMVRKST